MDALHLTRTIQYQNIQAVFVRKHMILSLDHGKHAASILTSLSNADIPQFLHKSSGDMAVMNM